MNQATILHTERLLLRMPTEEDIPFLVNSLNDPIFARNTQNIPFPYHHADGENWVALSKEGWQKKNRYHFIITHKETNLQIGGSGFHRLEEDTHAEFGYWIAKPFWDNGYATEALQRLITFAFETCNIYLCYATHFSYNQASGTVLRKCGFEECLPPKTVLKKGKEVTLHRYQNEINK